MEHLIGYLIVGLSALFTTGFVVFRWVVWRRRWHLDIAYRGGVVVRTDSSVEDTIDLRHELRIANLEIRNTIQRHWPDKLHLLDYRVEVVVVGDVRTPTVPNGTLPGGSLVGGSVRTEQFLPFTKKYWVAVVVDERTSAFLIHEVLAHIVPLRLTGKGDTHDASGRSSDKWIEGIEGAAKAAVAVELSR